MEIANMTEKYELYTVEKVTVAIYQKLLNVIGHSTIYYFTSVL